MDTIRVGIVGLGANCRLRHVDGLKSCPQVEISGVVNRGEDSTRRAAEEYSIPKTYSHWEQLVTDPELDAVVIGTWPYLHCPITLAALDAGKHVLTEARMACNAEEAHRMLEASQQHPQLVTQIVPSPLGFHALRTLRRMIEEGFLGKLREVACLSVADYLTDREAPLHWRQSAEYSGLNMLSLGIIHEAVTRWVPSPTRVLAQTQTFVTQRPHPGQDALADVGTPDSVHVLTELPDGARGIYHLSAAVHFGPGDEVHFYGEDGTIKYLMSPENELWAGRRGEDSLRKVEIPDHEAYDWQVEQDFIEAIRGEGSIEFTDFATGVRYMEFTEAVARSAQTGAAVSLPLA